MNIQEIKLATDLLNKLSISKLPTKSVIKIVDLANEINSKADSFYSARDKVIKSYGIKSLEELNKTENKELDTKLNELINEDFEIDKKYLNFLKKEEFFESSKENLKVQEIAFLVKILTK